MCEISRRTFVAGSGALALAAQPSWAWAEDTQQCASTYIPPYLTVNCAARKNYQVFRGSSERVHLAGLVSLVNFKGKYGQYNAGTLFLFPVLRPAQQQPKPQPGVRVPEISGLIPGIGTDSVPMPPLPPGQDEEALLSTLAPEGSRTRFLGFRVDVPANDGRSTLARFTEGRLPDGKTIRIEWTVSGLNSPWFNGSPTIPHDSTCGGATWRKVIIEGLKQATTEACL
jgi:hypothetical protein